MDYIEKDILINRIVAGIHICVIEGKEYVIRPPTREEKYRADLVYLSTLKEARQNKLPSEESISKMMGRKGFWTDADEESLNKLNDTLDDLKVSLYKNFFESSAESLRKQIAGCRDSIDALLRKKSDFAIYTDKWVASCARQRYIIACITREDSELMVDCILSYIRDEHIEDDKFRELARTDPWRSIWVAKVGDVFGVPSCDMTQEQQRLVLYSIMYDRVYESPERPADEIINDDDALDGWKIDQHRENELNKSKGEVINSKLSNSKIASADEVLVVVEKDKELVAVNELNDPGAKMLKRQREMQVKKDGVVPHDKFFDQALLIQDMANRRV